MMNWPPLLGCLSSTLNLAWGFLGATVVENLPANEEAQEMWVHSLGWEDPLEE